ncbi:ABC transporter substrate-binding protein [Phenylobacterium sp.]|uniref:ABC transporter substrate-binding protein n=1 Tax=Phenylobacterium sp. TaxID=1871053 RepID=UPI0011FDE540|nr:ABC transporter substrate-binding protein [Phenylobacterium sp.]THD70488.1 MAG: hopanoid biosynthesis protein HpnM [Phenylobacterium sp.]
MRNLSSLILAAPVAACVSVLPAHAQPADPAAVRVAAFDAALLDVMKQAKKLGPRGRYDALKPAVEQAFDLPTMTRFAVGTAWSTLPGDQQAELVTAFTRMTTATYAHNFDGYSGETFSIDKVDTRGPDKLVRTRLTGAGAPTELAYRMRQSGGGWKVIDVYYNSTVSSLLGQRSEFAATLSSGGATALAKKLNSRANQLLDDK